MINPRPILALRPAAASPVTLYTGVQRSKTRCPPRQPVPPRPPIETPDAETVIHRLEEAGHTLLCLPQSGHTTRLRQTRHDFVREALEAFAVPDEGRPVPPVPPPHRITRMDEALAWIPLISVDKVVLRRLVGCRCLVSPLTGRHLFSWRRLARLLGADHKAVQRWHANGIDLIVAALAADRRAASVWDAVSKRPKSHSF